MPMNIQARVTGVKAILDGGSLPTVREFEEHLRDAGFSKSLATAIAGKAAPHLRGEPDAKANRRSRVSFRPSEDRLIFLLCRKGIMK
jgi:hypothetical protein